MTSAPAWSISAPQTAKRTSSNIIMRGDAPKPTVPTEHPGRKSRTTAAGWVLDYLVPRNQTICLCEGCNHSFDGRKVNYTSLVQRFGLVFSKCDGCKKPHARCHMWMHDSLLGTKHGQCCDTRFL